MAGEMDLLRTLLEDAGLAVQVVPARRGLLGEDTARIVWTVLFDTPKALLEGWESEQAWLVDVVNEAHVSVDKSWELYLVLASLETPRQSEWVPFDKVRRDVSLTRKIVIPGVGTAPPALIANFLAPLRSPPIDSVARTLDALGIVELQAKAEGKDDVLLVLKAFRDNTPLFGGERN